MKSAVIIPARMASQRFPNKPMAKIAGIPMIERVWRQGIKSKIGDVFVACCENEVFDLISSKGGKAIMTDPNHPSGTDRIFEAYSSLENKNDYESIINLQGDMPNIDPEAIKGLITYMKKGHCDIGTLASEFALSDEMKDPNIVKVLVKEKIKTGFFSKALDFIRNEPKSGLEAYHHIGIYAFTSKALLRYVNLNRSKLELERKLEQLRAMENGMSIHVGYIGSPPLSVDTERDLAQVKKLMEKK